MWVRGTEPWDVMGRGSHDGRFVLQVLPGEANLPSMDWFKGKFTGNHGFLPLNRGFSMVFRSIFP